MNFRISIVAAATVLAACSNGQTGGPPAPAPVAVVKVATAQSGGVAASQAVYGAVLQNADTQFTLSAPVEAIVSRIVAPVGTAVNRGSLVIALSPSPTTRAALAKLSADARSAQQAYERARRLRADGLVSDAEVESARAFAQGAQASLGAISSQSGALSLRSPDAGFVQAIATNPGDLVSPGAMIATISRRGDLRARFGIDPGLVARISRGAGVRLETFGTAPPVTVPIVSIDPSLDPQTRLASIYVTVPAGLGTGGGQPLRGAVTLEQTGSAVVIPYSALLDDGGQPFVFVVARGVARRKDVTLGASSRDTVAVTRGVAAGEQVVVAGGTALEDGVKVRTK